MTAMKAMKKVKKVSKIAKGRGAKAAVLKGKKEKTVGGLTSANLVKNKRGKVVSKNASARGKKEKTVGGLTSANLLKNKRGKVVSKNASARSKKAFASSPLKKWSDATKKARKALGITGFCAVGGSSAQGKALYAKVKSILAGK